VEQSGKGPAASTHQDKVARKWRYETPITIDESSTLAEEEVGTAWLQLQLVHTGFRHLDTEEYRELSARLEAIERLFLRHRGKLEPYYRQCFAAENESKMSGPAGELYDHVEVRHIAAIQAQFLEDMFYALELDRHANAPDNRGWMNLFRRWGRSRTFNARLDDLRSTLTLGFLEFYDLYLRYYPCRIDEKPVPHPWDSLRRRRDDRMDDTSPPPTAGHPGPCGEPPKPSTPKHGAAVGPTIAGAPESVESKPAKLLPGLFLDAGIKEVEDLSPTDPEARSGPGPVTAAGGGAPEVPKGPASGVTSPQPADTNDSSSDPAP
jgi:hypothetical protein